MAYSVEVYHGEKKPSKMALMIFIGVFLVIGFIMIRKIVK